MRVVRLVTFQCTCQTHLDQKTSWTTWPGKVTRILSFGAFVEVAPPSGGEAVRGVANMILIDFVYFSRFVSGWFCKNWGLLHIREIRDGYIPNLEDFRLRSCEFLSRGPTDGSQPGRCRMNWAWAMTLRCKKSRFLKDCHLYCKGFCTHAKYMFVKRCLWLWCATMLKTLTKSGPQRYTSVFFSRQNLHDWQEATGLRILNDWLLH